MWQKSSHWSIFILLFILSTFSQKRGYPLKGESREKTPLFGKRHSFFLFSKLITSTALFNPPIRTRYFLLFGSRSDSIFLSPLLHFGLTTKEKADRRTPRNSGSELQPSKKKWAHLPEGRPWF